MHPEKEGALWHGFSSAMPARIKPKSVRSITAFTPSTASSHGLNEEDLLPGQEWAREIPRALQTSDFILIFLSRNSVAKHGYVQREMKLALDAWQELPEGTIHTIPVRIDDCISSLYQQHRHGICADSRGYVQDGVPILGYRSVW
jgi:hypothetical protein